MLCSQAQQPDSPGPNRATRLGVGVRVGGGTAGVVLQSAAPHLQCIVSSVTAQSALQTVQWLSSPWLTTARAGVCRLQHHHWSCWNSQIRHSHCMRPSRFSTRMDAAVSGNIGNECKMVGIPYLWLCASKWEKTIWRQFTWDCFCFKVFRLIHGDLILCCYTIDVLSPTYSNFFCFFFLFSDPVLLSTIERIQ